MNSFISDSDVVPIDCPSCSKPIGQTLGGLKLEPHVICVHCGAQIDTSKFVEGMRQAQKAVEEFGVALGKISRRR